MMSRRGFIKFITESAVGAWLITAFPSLAWAASMDVLYIRQLITSDSSKSRTIMWHSQKPHQEAEVHLRLKGENGPERVRIYKPAFSSFHDDGETIFLYSTHIDGLQEEAEYEYRVSYSGGTTPWYRLQTVGDNTSFKALIFPDSQCSDGYVTWRKVAHSAWEQHPDTDFFISMGDLVDNGEAGWQWRQWMDGTDKLWKNMPFAPIMGNHECYNLQWLCRLPVAYLHYFVLPYNESPRFARYYYSYDYGPVHFTVLNTQWDEINSLKSGMMTEQLAWLEKDIASSDKPWKIVLMHKDVIFYDDPSQNIVIDEVGWVFMPYFDKLGVDAVLTAHQHTYRRHDHIFNFEPAEQGPVYFCTGVAGNVRYDVPIIKQFDKVVLPQPEVDNYMTLEASEQELIFSCYMPEGKLMDKYVLHK